RRAGELLGLLPEQRTADLPDLLPRRPRLAEHGSQLARPAAAEAGTASPRRGRAPLARGACHPLPDPRAAARAERARARERPGRLTSEGILQVVAVTNPLGLGFEQALIGVKTSAPPAEVADEIARWPEADYVVVTAGRFDLVVEVVVADRQELLELTNRMRGL